MPRRKSKGHPKKAATEEETEEEATDDEEVIFTRPEPNVVVPIKFTEVDFPQRGELIIGTCTQISPHGAYFLIEGYEKLGQTAGFVHISELSSTWIRNIRKHIKEGQKAVCKVLRINPSRIEVDLSIRRVSDSQKRSTLKVNKQESRARSIMSLVAEQQQLTEENIKVIMDIFYNQFGNLYAALEFARDNKADALTKLGINPPTVAEAIIEFSTKELERPTVTLAGKINCSLYVRNGLEVLKDCFNEAMEAARTNNALDINVQNISAPDYRILIEAEDWKIAEKCWREFQTTFEKSISQYSPLSVVFARD